jgi:hypothetical protein
VTLRLKRQQDIKVDFDAFPQNLVELLDLCGYASSLNLSTLTHMLL